MLPSQDMLGMFVVFTSQQLGVKFTTQHETAWRKMISHMLDVLEEASQQANGTAQVLDNGMIPHVAQVDEHEKEAEIRDRHFSASEEQDLTRDGSENSEDIH